MECFTVTVHRNICYEQEIKYEVQAKDEFDAIKKFNDNVKIAKNITVEHDDISYYGSEDHEEYSEVTGLSISDEDGNESQDLYGKFDYPQDTESLLNNVKEYIKFRDE